MNYQKIYSALVNKRLKNPANTEYQFTEKHHIIPRSIDPSLEKEKTNIVCLSLREHFIAHLLLIKIYQTQNDLEKLSKALLAINLMINKNSKKQEWKDFKFTSRFYEIFRLEAAKSISLNVKQWMKEHKDQISGKKNGSYNTMWITNPLTNENKKIKKSESIPNGWINGRYTSPEICQKNKQAYKYVKRMWIRKKDWSEQKFVPANSTIPEDWERGSILKLSDEAKRKISEREKYPQEYYDQMKKFLLPIYQEYLLHPSRETYLDLQQKFDLQKWSWNNFLGKCKKYLS